MFLSLSQRKNTDIIGVSFKEYPQLGWFWHYGHFIHDFIMPMILYINDSNPNLKKIYLINNNLYRSGLPVFSIGKFKSMGEKLLNIKIEEVETSSLIPESVPLITLTPFGFGPYTPDMFTHINSHVNRTLTLVGVKARVILIERGPKRKLIDKKVTEENKVCLTSTGAERRSLQNHRDIAKVLKDKYKDLFANVILEDTSLEQQISLFTGAQIVIGQHGAGLCNIIWMTKTNDALVIEFPPFMCDTFKNMCSTMKINYERMEPKPQEILKKCEMIKINS
jgi:hypothetical protein